MAKIANITNLVAGDDIRVNVTITEISTGLTISKAWMTLKASPSDADAAGVQAEITSSATSDGQITATGSGGTATMYFILPRADTATLSADTPYLYDVQLKMSDGSLYTPLTGKAYFLASITDATS